MPRWESQLHYVLVLPVRFLAEATHAKSITFRRHFRWMGWFRQCGVPSRYWQAVVLQFGEALHPTAANVSLCLHAVHIPWSILVFTGSKAIQFETPRTCFIPSSCTSRKMRKAGKHQMAAMTTALLSVGHAAHAPTNSLSPYNH